MFKQFEGAFFLSLVIIIWVASAVITRAIFTSQDTNFNKPLFLTYFSTSWFMVYLIPLVFTYFRLKNSKPKESNDNEELNTLVQI